MSLHVLSETKQHLFESTTRVVLYIETAGAPQTGQTPGIYIKRVSDGFFFDGAAFVDTAGTPTLLAMAEVGATPSPGLYDYSLVDPGPLVPTPPTLQLSKDSYELRFVNGAETVYDLRELSRELRDINTQGS
jgi:hypothetical protein